MRIAKADSRTSKRLKNAMPRGTNLHGRYIILDRISFGAFSLVYSAFDLSAEERVCIKEFFPFRVEADRDLKNQTLCWRQREGKEVWEEGFNLFKKEADILANLQHIRSVTHLIDVFSENETAYIVMEYVEGRSLHEIVKKTGAPIEAEECLRFFLPLLDVLAMVHEAGVLHMDINPANLILQPDRSLKLIDFGISMEIASGEKYPGKKPCYSPPEIYRQDGKIGTWTDIYSLCMTICFCVTGKRPSSHGDAFIIADLDLSAFTPEIAKVIKEGLAPEPEDRIQTMEDLKHKLEKAMNT